MWKRKHARQNYLERSTNMSKLRFYSSDVFIILVAGIAIAFRSQITGTPAPFDAYPKLITGALILLSIACVIQTRFSTSSINPESTASSAFNAIVLVVGIAIYIVAISTIGYFVSSTLYLIIMFHTKRIGKPDEFLETKPIIVDFMISIAIVVSIAFIFKFALKLVFPDAWLF
jgi:hypothetical protein